MRAMKTLHTCRSGWGAWLLVLLGTELCLVPPPSLPPSFLYPFHDPKCVTLKQATSVHYLQSHCQDQMERCYRLIPVPEETPQRQHPPMQTDRASDRHLPSPQMNHTDTDQSIEITLDKASALPVLFLKGSAVCTFLFFLHKKSNKTPRQHISPSLPLADAVPTDPIDDSHPWNRAVANHSGGNTRQLMKTKTLLTTPSSTSTLRAQSGPFFFLLVFTPIW